MEEDIDNLITLFAKIGNKCSYEKICEMSQDEYEEYIRLLNTFKRTNSSESTTEEKGETLEALAAYTLKTSHIFEVYKNIRTSTNELDQLVRIRDNQKTLIGLNVIDKRLADFIGECKNYQAAVPVTYVGKVCSLLSTTQNKICILFSYYGVTGKGWKDSSGLIKKFYLSKENADDRFCVIDFNIKDFEEIANGSNILQIIHDKILALKNDTDYYKYLSTHEASSKINQ